MQPHLFFLFFFFHLSDLISEGARPSTVVICEHLNGCSQTIFFKEQDPLSQDLVLNCGLHVEVGRQSEWYFLQFNTFMSKKISRFLTR